MSRDRSKAPSGDSFSTGDVLLEIETDKAQMDVEAQEDGQMAKIMVSVLCASSPGSQGSFAMYSNQKAPRVSKSAHE